jgi:hypothetical protein
MRTFREEHLARPPLGSRRAAQVELDGHELTVRDFTNASPSI